MSTKLPAILTILSASAIIAGCGSQAGNIFRNTAQAPAPLAVGGAAPATIEPNPASPYVLSAQSAGPYIDFTIHNMGATDLVVQKEHFAVISAESREVTPYAKATTIIDMPQPAIVKPNSTLSGRAIFRKVSAPIGKRLVFKPDATGTYADINRATAVQ